MRRRCASEPRPCSRPSSSASPNRRQRFNDVWRTSPASRSTLTRSCGLPYRYREGDCPGMSGSEEDVQVAQTNVRLEARSVAELMTDAYEYAYDQGWTDGLPIIPPTPDAVSRSVAASGR